MSEEPAAEPELKVKLTKEEKKAKYRNDIPEPIKSRREVFKHEFQIDDETREQRIRDFSFQCFDEDIASGSNIYGSVLEHFKAMPDRTKTSGPNLTSIYLDSFKLWLEKNQNEEELKKKFLTKEIQQVALFSCNGVPQYSKRVFTLFDVDPLSFSDEILESIREKLAKREFKEAAENVISHNLKDDFTFDEIILPLILQDKLQIVYEYMKGMPKLQRQFVKWHDDFIGKSELSIEATVERLKYFNGEPIMVVNSSKLVGKKLEKYMNSIFNKIAKDYQFEVLCSRDAPKFESKKHEKALKHFVSSKYDFGAKNKATDDIYFQNVRSTLEQCLPSDVERFLHYLWSSKEEEKHIDALSWYRLRKLSVYSEEIPGKMRDYLRSGSNLPLLEMADELLKRRISMETRLEGNGEQLYLFPKEEKIPINVINNDSGLDHLCALLKFYEESDTEEKYIGVDTEWKPAHLTQSTMMKIAIMQIYFCDKVYIVDCYELEKDPTIREETWKKFAKRLLCSDKFRVVGFDLKNDIDALLSIEPLKGITTYNDVKNVYCLKRLTENICEVDMSILGLIRKTFKLADLTETFLKITLDKAEQCSNWQSRPLRKNQIVYAAMDSYVVVEIYCKIFNILRETNGQFNLEAVLKESNVLAPRKEGSKRENKKIETFKWIEIYETLNNHRDVSKPLKRPNDLKCIVDTMLLGFGKNLRRCGIDVLIPHDVREFHNTLNTIKRAGGNYMRYILTVPSKSYESLRAEYPDVTIALPEITTKTPLEQLSMFFEQFNLDIRPGDVFLRCVDCNSRYLVRFPSPVIHFLHQYMIIHVQNVYRADMSEFPLDTWFNQMKQINSEDYEGVEVEMSRPSENSDWIVAKTSEGHLHIGLNTVKHNNCCAGVEVRINKVPDDVFQRSNLVFYVCSECGKVNYDGRKVNPSSKCETTSGSNSNESVIGNTK